MRTHSRWSSSAWNWEFRDEAGPLYASNSDLVFNGPLANFGVATTQSCGLPKENSDQLKKAVKPILGRINAPRLHNGRYQNLQRPALTEKRQSVCPSRTTSSMAVAAMWTSAPDAASTSPTMSSFSTNPLSADLATLMYFTFILDHLKHN